MSWQSSENHGGRRGVSGKSVEHKCQKIWGCLQIYLWIMGTREHRGVWETIQGSWRYLRNHQIITDTKKYRGVLEAIQETQVPGNIGIQETWVPGNIGGSKEPSKYYGYS